jgi:hypothetical protein
LSSDEEAARRLAALVDQARVELGLSKHDLGKIARVSRPTVSRLINHALVPAREATLDRIGAALGWEPGTCEAVLAGGEPTLRAGRPDDGLSQSAKLVAERLAEIAAEAKWAAQEAERSVHRLRVIEEQARAAVRLVQRTT